MAAKTLRRGTVTVTVVVCLGFEHLYGALFIVVYLTRYVFR